MFAAHALHMLNFGGKCTWFSMSSTSVLSSQYTLHAHHHEYSLKQDLCLSNIIPQVEKIMKFCALAMLPLPCLLTSVFTINQKYLSLNTIHTCRKILQ